MRFVFRFRWVPFAAAVLVAAIGIVLGQWQTRRAHEKEAIDVSIRERGAMQALDLNDVLPEANAEFRRAIVRGQFVANWPVYLDNRPYNGAAGFYVLMPFRIAGTNEHMLVARGWVQRNPIDRAKLPTIPVPEGTVQLQGVLRHDAGHVMELGASGPLKPGAIVQNANAASIAQAAGIRIVPLMLEQTSDTQDGLVRDWPLPSAGVERHRGYAFQWYGLAATALIFFVVTGFRRGTS
jgi:cytochrome oxidase assembly protein ShyY1